MTDRYLTIREVSKIIGVTPLTLRNWDKKGLLAAYRNPLNNYRLYRYADVADLVAAIKKSGKPPDPSRKHKIAVTVEDWPENAPARQEVTA